LDDRHLFGDYRVDGANGVPVLAADALNAVCCDAARRDGSWPRAFSSHEQRTHAGPDAALEFAASVLGADSIEAEVLANLRRDRARDRQVHAFRCGEWWMIGPMPDAITELAIIELAKESLEQDN
jgi:hypothetical protein